MSDDSDPYLYPGTDVLKNVPDLRDAEQLAAFEALNTAARTYELLRNPIAGGFDLAHLKAIHKHVFQDVFAWSGELRTTMLGKAEYPGLPSSCARRRSCTPSGAMTSKVGQTIALRGLSCFTETTTGSKNPPAIQHDMSYR